MLQAVHIFSEMFRKYFSAHQLNVPFNDPMTKYLNFWLLKTARKLFKIGNLIMKCIPCDEIFYIEDEKYVCKLVQCAVKAGDFIFKAGLFGHKQ